MRFSVSSTFLPLSIVSLVAGQSFDCKTILADGQAFDISPLEGPHSVVHLHRTPTALKNTTFTIDLCKPLDRAKSTDKNKECPSSTRVCGYERFYLNNTEGEPDPLDVWPVAGDFIHENRRLDPEITRLKNSDSHADAEKEGLRISINGGINDDVKQKVIIELICDPDHTGLDNVTAAASLEDTSRRKRDEGDEKTGDGDKEEDPDPNAGKALQLVSYKPESTGGKSLEDVNVLRLSWRTKYACEGQKGKPDTDRPASKSSHWGFFTWFIIILFMVIAGYIIFGSWLNYSQHGARGWDLLPHGDILQDVPYLLKDWARKVMNTVQGVGGNRGGYSAVG